MTTAAGREVGTHHRVRHPGDTGRLGRPRRARGDSSVLFRGDVASRRRPDRRVRAIDLSRCRGRDLPPFAAADEAGARAVMTAHVRFPAVDAQPATAIAGLTVHPQPVVAVIDASHRHAAERQLLAAVLAVRPDTVVVQTGLGDGHPLTADRWMRAWGAGRAYAEVVADLLLDAPDDAP